MVISIRSIREEFTSSIKEPIDREARAEKIQNLIAILQSNQTTLVRNFDPNQRAEYLRVSDLVKNFSQEENEGLNQEAQIVIAKIQQLAGILRAFNNLDSTVHHRNDEDVFLCLKPIDQLWSAKQCREAGIDISRYIRTLRLARSKLEAFTATKRREHPDTQEPPTMENLMGRMNALKAEEKASMIAHFIASLEISELASLRSELDNQYGDDFDSKGPRLAQWVNESGRALTNLFTEQELFAMAPHLITVNIVDQTFPAGQEYKLNSFLQDCRNLENLTIQHSNLRTLDLGSLTLLQNLNCSGCTRLQDLQLSGLSALTRVDCSNCPELRLLNCSGCENLRRFRIPDSNALENLHLSGCRNLQNLLVPHPDSIHTLNLSGCELLRILDFSTWTSLRHLDCSNCSQATTLHVYGLNTLEDVNCTGCNALREFDCSDCLMLRTVGEVLPTSCEEFTILNCSQLQLPQVAPHCRVIATPLTEEEEVRYNFDPRRLQNESLEVLMELGAFLTRRQGLPIITWIDENTGEPSLGVDAGGLRRQAVTSLCSTLFTERRLPLQTRDGKIFPTLREPEAGAAHSPENERITRALTSLGWLMAHCSNRNEVIGTRFGLNFYRAIFSLSDEELNEIRDNQPLTDTLKRKLYANLIGILEANLTGVDISEYLEEAPIVYSTAIIAKSIKDALGDGFQRWRGQEETFMHRVQGIRVSADLLNDKITYRGTAPTSARTTVRNYLQTWIDQHRNDPETLTKLVLFITGSSSLAGDIEVKVDAGIPHDHLPHAHTCFNSINFPAYPGDMSVRIETDEGPQILVGQDAFNYRLETAMKSQGFQFA